MSGERNPFDRIRAIVKKDPSYRVEAYCYVFEALDYTLRSLPKPRHVSGQELCDGIRSLAIERFGPLARTVFAPRELPVGIVTAAVGAPVFALLLWRGRRTA